MWKWSSPGCSVAPQQALLRDPQCDHLLLRSVLLAVRQHQALFPCSCSDERKNSINKIRSHRRTGWAVAIATPLHHFSPESRSLILDAGSGGKSDLAGPGKWQTVKALVTMGNPEWVSRPDAIYTAPSFEICSSCQKASEWWKNISRGWCQSTFYAFTSNWWASGNRRCTCWNPQ